MGFTLYSTIIYLFLFIADLFAFVKGKENYIKNINENIEKWTEKSKNVEIIDCYDMEEISQDMDNIMDQYKFTLKTTGKNIIK